MEVAMDPMITTNQEPACDGNGSQDTPYQTILFPANTVTGKPPLQRHAVRTSLGSVPDFSSDMTKSFL